MEKAEKLELLLKYRSGEIEGEDLLKQLQVPRYGFQTQYPIYRGLYLAGQPYV